MKLRIHFRKNGIEHIHDLVDELVDNVINTPDDEILQEIEDEYGDKEALANKMRQIITEAKTEIDK